MTKRTSEQPYNWDDEADETRLLPSLEDETVELDASTAPTRVIQSTSTAQPAVDDDRTEVLRPISSRTSFEDETVVLPRATDPTARPISAQQTRAFGISTPPRTVSTPASPLTPAATAAPAEEPATPSRGLQTFRPSNIRQTRPTTWAMVQHFMTLVTFLLLLWATIAFFVQTPAGQYADETAFEEFSYQFLNYQDQTMTVLDWIPAFAGILAAIGLIFVLVWKHRFVPAIVGLIIALGANSSTQIIKNYLLTKPNFGVQDAVLNSAPSGHTTFAAAAGSALFLASPKKLRPTIAFFSAIFTLATGFSTVINGWHRPGDVISAIFLTGAWTVIGLAILRFLRSEELDMSNTQRSGLILIPLATITSFFMAFCAGILYIANHYQPFSGATMAAASCLIISAVTFTLAMLVSLLRPQNKQRKVYTKVWTY